MARAKQPTGKRKPKPAKRSTPKRRTAPRSPKRRTAAKPATRKRTPVKARKPAPRRRASKIVRSGEARQPIAGEREAMLRAVEAALAAGATASRIRRDPDFAQFLDDPGFHAVLDRATPPPIPVDIAPHLAGVRLVLDSVIKTLRDLGEVPRLEPGATLDAVLAAERAREIQLPNDYRAFLTLCDGMSAWEHHFLGTVDYRNDTELMKRARRYQETSAQYGAAGLDECVPLASWGQPEDWLFYDPRGRFRGGIPGYVLMLDADERPLDDFASALQSFEERARDVLDTN